MTPPHMDGPQFAEIHAKLAAQGGFTVNPRTGAEITSGISVAPRQNERRVPVAESAPSALAEYHAANAARFGPGPRQPGAPRGPAVSRNASLGGWRSPDGEDVFDTPTVYKNTPRGEVGARKQMVLSGQEAGFKLDTFEEIPNPFHPRTREVMGKEPHELANIAGRDRSGSEFAARQPEVQAWIESPRSRAKLQGRSLGR